MNCRVCGNEIEAIDAATIEDDSLAAVIAALESAVVCDECFARHVADQAAQNRVQAKIERVREAVALGDLPESFRSFKFAASKPEIEQLNQAAWDYARTWRRDSGNLYIQGTPGSGKTRLGLALLNKAADHGVSAAIVTPTGIQAALHEFQHGRAKLDRWAGVGLLLLDDIDKVSITDFSLAGIWELFNERCARNLRIIITANVSIRSLTEIWIAKSNNRTMVTATIDRLAPCKVVEMTGESNRGAFTKLSA